MNAALFGGAGADWAGPGTGVKGAGLARKIAVIDEALAHHRTAIAEHDPLALLAAVACVGGYALLGAAGVLGVVLLVVVGGSVAGGLVLSRIETDRPTGGVPAHNSCNSALPRSLYATISASSC